MIYLTKIIEINPCLARPARIRFQADLKTNETQADIDKIVCGRCSNSSI